MTTIYFIRHAQSEHHTQDERTRGLSARGQADVAAVTRFLDDKQIDAAFSSPYQRAIDTIADFAEKHCLPIRTMEGLREWYRLKNPSVSFEEMCRRHWADWEYQYASGESLREVQQRNIAALEEILTVCKDKCVIVGTHGMALSTVIRYYRPHFGFDDFTRLLPLMPLVVKMTFWGTKCLTVEQIEIV